MEEAAFSFVIHECKRRVGELTEIIVNLLPLCNADRRAICAEEFAETVYSRVKDSEDFLFILADVDPEPYILDREGRKPASEEVLRELERKHGVIIAREEGAYDIIGSHKPMLSYFIYDDFNNVFIAFRK